MAYENFYLNNGILPQNNYASQLEQLQARLAQMEQQQQQNNQQLQQTLQQSIFGTTQPPLKNSLQQEFEKSPECENIYMKHFNNFLMTTMKPQFENSKFYREDCYKEMNTAFSEFEKNKNNNKGEI